MFAAQLFSDMQLCPVAPEDAEQHHVTTTYLLEILHMANHCKLKTMPPMLYSNDCIIQSGLYVHKFSALLLALPPVTFLFLCVLVHLLPCCLKTAWQKLGGAVTPLPRICEWAPNEEMRVQ